MITVKVIFLQMYPSSNLQIELCLACLDLPGLSHFPMLSGTQRPYHEWYNLEVIFIAAIKKKALMLRHKRVNILAVGSEWLLLHLSLWKYMQQVLHKVGDSVLRNRRTLQQEQPSLFPLTCDPPVSNYRSVLKKRPMSHLKQPSY